MAGSNAPDPTNNIPQPVLVVVEPPATTTGLSRTQLVQQFYLYDSDLLRRLLVIADTILVPNQNQLINVDFSRMIEYAHSLADVFFPEWTDRSKSDFGEFLVELMALFSDKDFWYINNLSREGFASLAQNYSNLVAKAISNGVDVPLRRSASAVFSLEVLGGVSEVVERGALEFGLSGLPEMTFTNEEFTLPPAASQSTVGVTLYHGQIRSYSGNFNGRSVLLTDPDICAGSVLLNVDGVRWTETLSFKGGNSQTKHFMVLPDETGRAEVVFARGGFGTVPAYGALVEATYRIGGGLLGNLDAGTLTSVVKADTTRAVVAMTQVNATTGGTEQLTLEELRMQTVTIQRTRNTAVSADDAQRLAKLIPGVHNAHLTVISNFMFLSVVPVGGGVPTQALLDTVQAYFDDGRTLLNYTLLPSGPEYVGVLLEADVYILADQPNAGTKQVIEELLQSYLDESQDGQYGRAITLVELNRLILSRVTGAQNVDFVRLQRLPGPLAAPANVLLAPNQLVRWSLTTVTIRVQGGY